MANIDVTVNASSLVPNTANAADLDREEAIEYAKNMVTDALAVFEISPIRANITLRTEGNDRDPVQKCNINVSFNGGNITKSAHSRSVKKAIDRCYDDIRRQMRRSKTEIIDKRRSDGAKAKRNGRKTFGPVESDE